MGGKAEDLAGSYLDGLFEAVHFAAFIKDGDEIFVGWVGDPICHFLLVHSPGLPDGRVFLGKGLFGKEGGFYLDFFDLTVPVVGEVISQDFKIFVIAVGSKDGGDILKLIEDDRGGRLGDLKDVGGVGEFHPFAA